MHNFFKTEKTNAEIKKDGGIKLMKLLSAILIITAMAFSMTACGNNADKGNDGDVSDKIEQGVDNTTDAVDDATNSVTDGIDEATDDMLGDDNNKNEKK